MDIVNHDSGEFLWIFVSGFIVAIILAFAIGANDVANTFGTTVGARVLTVQQACLLATFFEIAGAVLIGDNVAETMRNGIIDLHSFNGTEQLAMAGAFSSLTSTSVWLLVVTFLGLPVSATHSIVGSTLGYAIVEHGIDGIHFFKLGLIAISWVASPLLSGIMASLVYIFIRKAILNKEDSFERGLRILPFFYSFTMIVFLFSILHRGHGLLYFKSMSMTATLAITFGCAFLTALFSLLVIVPWIKSKINEQMKDEQSTPSRSRSRSQSLLQRREDDQLSTEAIEMNTLAKGCEQPVHPPCIHRLTWKQRINRMLISEEPSMLNLARSDPLNLHEAACRSMVDEPKIYRLFSQLQVLTSCCGSFTHGGNNVSNAVAPLVTLLVIYKTGQIDLMKETPLWMLFIGGVGMAIGLCVMGRRVIRTMGEGLAPVTASSGFSIEIGSALTVLIASNLGIPISTTHCKVGSVVMVGRVRSSEVVNWNLFRNIVWSWIITMPCTGGLSALIYVIIKKGW